MKLLQYSFSIFTLIFMFSVFCFGQEKIRNVGKEFQYNKVIDVVELKVKDKKFKFDESVLGDKDWIKNLTVRFKNISNKAICYANINLIIQPVGKLKIPLQLNLKYGMPINLMELVNKEAVSNYSHKIQPGQTFDVSLSESGKQFLDSIVEEYEISEIEHTDVSPDFILFEDSRVWSLGHEVQQNTVDPAHWLVIGKWFEDKNVLGKKKL